MQTFKYLVLGGMLVSCTSVKKNVNRSHTEASKKEAVAIQTYRGGDWETTRLKVDSTWWTLKTDSGYNRVTREDVIEWIVSGDTVIIHPKQQLVRQTRREILETGNRRVEQAIAGIARDSTAQKVSVNAQQSEVHQIDSSGTSTTIVKNVSRKSFLPWWLWLILAVTGGLCWWKRGFITDKIIGLRNSL